MADLILTLTMAVWGSSFAVLRFFLLGAGGDPSLAASPLAVLAVRMAIASSLLGLFMLVRRKVLGKPELAAPGAMRTLLRDGALVGGLLALGFLLQTEGLSRTSASRSGFFTGLLVVFVPVLEFLFFRKKPALPALLALGLAFFGMALLAGPVVGAPGGSTLLGDLLTVGCALVFAGQIIALGRAAPRNPILPLTLIQLVMVGLAAALVGPLIEPTQLPRDPRLAAAIVYLAVFATLIAFLVQTWAQRVVSPVRMALLSALEPVFAALFAAVLIHERLERRELLGGGLIVAGVIVGELGAALRTHQRGAQQRRDDAAARVVAQDAQTSAQGGSPRS